MRRYFASCASSSVISGPLEDRARVGPRGIEEQRVEVVAQVVVVLDVALGAAAGRSARGRRGRRRWSPVSAAPGRLVRAALGRDRQDLQQPHQVVGAPVAGDVRLAHRQAPARGQPAPQVARRDRHLHVRPRRRVAAAAHRAVGQPHRDAARAPGGPAPTARRARATGVSGERRGGGAGGAARAASGCRVAGGRGDGRRRARSLARDEPGLAVERHPLHRELHRLPVDEADDLLGHQRIAGQRPRERRVGERAPPPGQLAPRTAARRSR